MRWKLSKFSGMIGLVSGVMAWGGPPSHSAMAGPGTPLSVRHWGTDDGLGPGPITTILQTRDGYLWFGSEEGLMRFSGNRCTIFDSRNSPEMRSHKISQLFEDRAGYLWIGTAGGGVLRRSSDGAFRLFGRTEGLLNERVSAMTQDADGRIWVGTDGGGLFEFEGERFRAFSANGRLPSPHITALAADASGHIWVGSKSRLSRLRGGEVDPDFLPSGQVPRASSALLLAGDGTVWVGNEAGLYAFKSNRFEALASASAVDLRRIQTLAAGADGRLWIGTPRGVVRLDGGEATRVTTEQGLSGNLVQCVYRDREGSIWVGSDVPGVDQIRATRFANLSTQHGLSHPVTTGIYEDHQGALWIGGHHGINLYDGGNMVRWTKRDGLAGNLVFTMCEEPGKGLWIGTLDGLSLFSEGRFRTFTTADGLPRNVIWTLYRDRSNRVWAGTPRGLVQIQPGGGFRVFDYDNAGLSHNDVRVLCEDTQGRLWIGTSFGLNCLDNGQITQFIEWSKGRPFNVVLALHVDPAGDLWVGTMEQGLFRFRNGQFFNFSVEDGLYDNLVFQILEDNLGWLWLTCNRGISRVRKADLNALAEGRLRRVECSIFGKSDGLPSAECNGTFQPAGGQTRDGRLWFPTSKGVAVVDPAYLPRNPVLPPVQVEEVLFNGLRVDSSEPLRVGPEIDRLEIHYAGLSFIAPGQVQFKYRMEGLDENWGAATTDRIARYPRLPPGEYRFRVKACNNDGVWNEAGASLALTVFPPWWGTTWFRTIIGVSAVGLIGGIARLLTSRTYRRRMRELERDHALEMERMRIATDLHDEVGSNLGSIALLSQSAKREAGATVAQDLAEIHQLANQTAESMRDIVWFIDTCEDEWQRLLLRMKETAGRLLAGTRWQLHTPTVLPVQKLSPEFKRHFFLIFKESLHNIAKHAQASQVDIWVNVTQSSVHLEIRDNGIGFAEPAITAGLGLNGMRRRAVNLGWKLDVVNRPEGGTVVKLETGHP